MAQPTWTETEKRLYETSKILRRLVDAVNFNSALAFTIARQTGVKLPYGIEMVNNRSQRLRREIRAMIDPVLDPDREAEREEIRGENYTAVSYKGRVVYMAKDKPESEP